MSLDVFETRKTFRTVLINCIDNLSFLTVVNSADLSALRGNGLVGLAPTPPHQEELSDPMQNGVPGFIA